MSTHKGNHRTKPASRAGRRRLPWPDLSPRAATAAGFALCLAAYLADLPWLLDQRSQLFVDGSLPLPLTADAFFYLRLTRDILDGRTAWSAAVLHGPLLPVLAAAAQKVTFLPLEWVAQLLPCLLGGLVALPMAAWCSTLGLSPVAALMAAPAMTASIIWVSRTGLGIYRTDGLVMVLALAIPWFAYRHATGSGPRRHAWLTAAAAAAYVLHRWWDSNVMFGPLLFLAALSLSLMVSRSLVERLLKLALILLGAALLGLILSGRLSLLPPDLARPLEQAAGNLKTLTKAVDSVFAAPSVSIQENVGLSLVKVAEFLAGSPVVLAAGLAGLLLLLARRWRDMLPLAPLLAIGLAGPFSNRLLIFYVPFHCLGLAYLLDRAVWSLPRMDRIAPGWRRTAFTLVVMVMLLAPGLLYKPEEPIVPLVTTKEVRLARAMQSTPRDTMVWAWWDYGYFLRYMADRPVFIDNGSQSPDRVFVSAVPLVSNDYRLAANWIRLFAARGLEELGRLGTDLGMDKPAVLDFLKQVLADPGRLASCLPEGQRPHLDEWRSRLFPDVRPVLCLTAGTIDRYVWMHYFGRWDYHARQGIAALPQRLAKADALVDSGRGMVVDRKGQRYLPAQRFLWLSDRISSAQAEAKAEEDNIAIIPSDWPFMYVVGPEPFSTLAFRLLYDAPYDTPGFRPLYYHPLHGGVWTVDG